MRSHIAPEEETAMDKVHVIIKTITLQCVRPATKLISVKDASDVVLMEV